MGHTLGYSCLNSIPNNNVMSVVMFYVLSPYQLLFYKCSFKHHRSIIITFLWLLRILILNIIGDL